MSIKFNESLSKKVNYHQKGPNTKTSVSTGNNFSKSLNTKVNSNHPKIGQTTVNFN